MKLHKIRIERSNKYIVEKRKPIIPTIIFWSDSIGNYKSVALKFVFWRWWVNLSFVFKKEQHEV